MNLPFYFAVSAFMLLVWSDKGSPVIQHLVTTLSFASITAAVVIGVVEFIAG